MKIKFFPALLFFIFVHNVLAQTNIPTDYLTSDFHKSRREALRSSMPDNSVAVFFSNAIRNRANDVEFVYHQEEKKFNTDSTYGSLEKGSVI